MARAIALLSLVPLLAAAQNPTTAPAQPAAKSAYVGSNACKTCHADIWLNFYKNPHYKTITSGDAPVDKTGCEGCHGPAQAHIAAGGGKDTIPRAFSLLTPKQTMDACLACHEANLDKANIRRSEHTQHDVACTSCHSVHHSPTPKYLLAKKESELCFSCHSNVRGQFEMPSHHRVNEGVVQCDDCHNPHGSFAATWNMGQRSHTVEQALNNEVPCLKCHVDKRGPFVFEHPSVRVEGCMMCHSPHGSMNNKLLTRTVEFTLCLQCHNAGGSGTRSQGVDLQTARHNLLDPKFQRCTTCHVRIHGSNADQYFLR